MKEAWHQAAARRFAVAVVCALCAIAPVDEVAAQGAAKEPARAKSAKKAPAIEPKADLVTAQRYVETGVTHLEAGRLDAAVSSLTSALAAGSLPAAQTARALHYRGVAYRRQGKPAQALSDLTSALSVRNGLTETQRAESLKERAAAYRDAGLPDQSEADTIKVATKSAPDTTASGGVATTGTARTGNEPSAAPSSGGFFSSLFGGGAKTEAAPAPPPAPAPASPVQTAAAWGSGTQVRSDPVPPEPKAEAVARPAAAAAPAVKTKATATPSGTVLVQVALVRNRSEAEAIASRIQAKHAKALAGRQTTIDEVVLGNMGTLYRLRVGPYAAVADSNALCARLRSEGLDCMTGTR